MTDSDNLVAMLYAASTHSLDEFLTRYKECSAALKAGQQSGATRAEADATAKIGDELGGPA